MPVNPNTDWVIYDADEVIELVERLHDEGEEPSDIGRILRDQYGVPSVTEVAGQKISSIVEQDEEFPEDLRNLMRQAINLQEHIDDNPKDLSAKRELDLTEARIRRLVEYYRGDDIPDDWTYNIEKARLVVE
jgi:small subunit ribosomal protein S15